MRKSLMIGLTTLSLAIGGLGVAYAGGKFGYGPMGDGPHLGYMAERLDLSPEQQKKIDELMASRFADMREQMRTVHTLRQSLHSLDPTAADYQQQADTLAKQVGAETEKLMSLRAAQHKAFNEILTAEQRQKMQDHREDRYERRGWHSDDDKYEHRGDRGKRYCRD